jgi:hypothetical protein
VNSNATTSSLSIDFSNVDMYIITALAEACEIGSSFIGTPLNGDSVIIRIKDNGTSRALTYGSGVIAIGTTLPSTTTPGFTIYLGGFWSAEDSALHIVAVSVEV